MANRFFGEASTEVDGRMFTLRMDWNAMCELEGKTGRNALDMIGAFEAGTASASDMRDIVWATMLRHHPDATARDAGDILSADPEVMTRIMAASMPEADEGNAKAAKGKAA